jgi:hypothetical protein
MKAIKICCFILLMAAAPASFERLMGKGTKHWKHAHHPQDQALLKRAEALYGQPRRVGEEKIPKVVHFIWLGPKPFPPGSVETVRQWMACHPTWKFKFWTDRERQAPCNGMERVVFKTYPFERLKRCYEESQNWGEKSDLLRYELLYEQGGVYTDHDMKSLKSFEEFHKLYDFYCGLEPPHPSFAEYYVTVGNALIGAKPGHPVMRKVMERVLAHWDLLAQKYPGRDGFSRTQIVMERTYLPFTDGVLEKVTEEGMIFPAAYFFAKSGMKPIYAKHLFANTWAQGEDKKFEQEVVKKVGKLEKRAGQLEILTVVSLTFNFLLLGFLVCYSKTGTIHENG